MSDEYIGQQPLQGLPPELRDPEQKKANEQQALNQLNQLSNKTVPSPEDDQYKDDEKIIVKNNRAHSQHFVDAGVVIPGQVVNDTRGPFAFLSKKQIEADMPLYMAFEEKVGKNTPPLSIIDKDTYMREYRIFNERRIEREKMDEKHRALDGDEMDSQQEDFKVHYNVLDNVQPDKAVPSSNENSRDVGSRIRVD